VLAAALVAQQIFGVPWSDALTAIGTTLAVVIALLAGFSNRLRSWLVHPRLHASIESRLPDCHVVDATEVVRDRAGQPIARKISDQYYCRLRINNGGFLCTSATDVELRLYRLWDITKTPAVEVTTFLPLNLNWSHVLTTPLVPERKQITPLIQPRVFRHCDLCFVDSRFPNELRFCAEPEPNPIGGQRATVKPVGTYELDLTLVGANFPPEIVTVRIDFTGKWPAAGKDFPALLKVSVLRQGKPPPKKHPV
jgi:hypothetical protein